LVVVVVVGSGWAGVVVVVVVVGSGWAGVVVVVVGSGWAGVVVVGGGSVVGADSSMAGLFSLLGDAAHPNTAKASTSPAAAA